jgi:hypothetical protein
MHRLHPLAPNIATSSQAAASHRRLCQLCSLNPALNEPQPFELTPELDSQLDHEFFHDCLPLELLETNDWHIYSDLTPGWEVVRINDHILTLLAGAGGQRGPAPFDLQDHFVHLDVRADLDWLADWPQIRCLHLPHALPNLHFLRHVLAIEKLSLADVSRVEDFSPLNQPEFLGEVTFGSLSDPKRDPGSDLSERIRSQVFNVPEVNFNFSDR